MADAVFTPVAQLFAGAFGLEVPDHRGEFVFVQFWNDTLGAIVHLLTVNGWTTHQQFMQDRSQRKDICSRIDIHAIRACLFGTHVLPGSQCLTHLCMECLIGQLSVLL